MPAVRALRFANLTQPILDQMRESVWTWRSLRNIALEGRQGAVWGPGAAAGSVELKLARSGEVRAALQFWSAPNTCGPDTLRNKRLDVNIARLPETLMAACAGRRVGEIVAPARFHGAVDDQIVSRVTREAWGLALHLKTAYVQPADADLERMLELHHEGLRQHHGREA